VSEVLQSSRVYVDDMALPFGPYIMYHMFSPHRGALHAMAERIGIARRHFQDPATMRVSWPHYDIPHELRLAAIELGAVTVDRFQMVAMSGVITGKADPLDLFRGDYYQDQRTRLEQWLRDEGFPVRA